MISRFLNSQETLLVLAVVSGMRTMDGIASLSSNQGQPRNSSSPLKVIATLAKCLIFLDSEVNLFAKEGMQQPRKSVKMLGTRRSSVPKKIMSTSGITEWTSSESKSDSIIPQIDAVKMMNPVIRTKSSLKMKLTTAPLNLTQKISWKGSLKMLNSKNKRRPPLIKKLLEHNRAPIIPPTALLIIPNFRSRISTKIAVYYKREPSTKYLRSSKVMMKNKIPI